MIGGISSFSGLSSIDVTKHQKALFAKIDSDGDGKVTKTEFESFGTSKGIDTAKSDEIFNSIDTSGSGSISQQQFLDAKPPARSGSDQNGGGLSGRLSDDMLKAIFLHKVNVGNDTGSTDSSSQLDQIANSLSKDAFSKLDSDGDGKVTKSEFEDYLTAQGQTKDAADQLYATIDTNGTGSFTQSQLADALKKEIVAHLPPAFSSDSSSSSDSTSPLDAKATELSQRLFKSLDTDGDGKVTKAEFENYLKSQGESVETADAIFAKIDSGNTGSITQDQLTAALKKQLAADGPPPGATPPDFAAASTNDASTIGSSDKSSGTSSTKTIKSINTTTDSDGTITTVTTYTDGTSTTTVVAGATGKNKGGIGGTIDKHDPRFGSLLSSLESTLQSSAQSFAGRGYSAQDIAAAA